MASICFQNLSTVLDNKVPKNVKPKDATTLTDVKSENAKKLIEYQISMRKKKLDEKKKVFHNYAVCTSAEALQDFLVKDIDSVLVKKKWKDLGACFEWKFIEAYLASIGCPEDSDLISKAFKAKQLPNVEYDIKTNSIVKLNYEFNGKQY